MSTQQNTASPVKAIVNEIETAFVGWYILSNGWEVYLTEEFDDEGYASALVCGAENEFGSVSLEEHKPYIVTKCLGDIFFNEVKEGNLAPPINGKWLLQ